MKASGRLCSVVIPVYKHEAYLEEALESVFEQTHRDLELILIDDCSPDDSFAIACRHLASPRFKQRFRRLECLRNDTNSGAHASLNRGLSLAAGDYLFLLNSDDRFHPERISVLLNALETTGSRFAFSAINPLCKDGQLPPANALQLAQLIRFSGMTLPSRSFAFLSGNCTITTGNFAMRRDLYHQTGPFAGLLLAHDWDYVLRVMTTDEPVYVDRPLYDYRVHSSNTFSQLGALAGIETEVCLTRYFTLLTRGSVRNPLCPNPRDWPGIFEWYLARRGLTRLWERVAHGYVASGRTVAPVDRPGLRLAALSGVGKA